MQKETTIGDAAVDGLFSSVVAGILMAAYLVVVGLLLGEGAGTMLGRFAASGTTSPAVGALSHLAASAVYGIVFALGWRLVPRTWRRGLPAWLGGVVYGLLLLLLAWAVILPAFDSPLREIPLLHFAVAHGVYGLALGWLAGRRRET